MLAEQQRITERRSRQQPLPSFVDAMFEHTLALLHAEQQWIERTLARLGQEGNPDA